MKKMEEKIKTMNDSVEMMNSIVKKFGFEDPHTIGFYIAIQLGADIDVLQKKYDELMDLNVILDE